MLFAAFTFSFAMKINFYKLTKSPAYKAGAASKISAHDGYTKMK